MKSGEKTLARRLMEMPPRGELLAADLPRLDLYMDQVTTILGEVEQGGRGLTKTMVNNYSKEGLLRPIKGKKYSREHLLILELIRGLKESLSMAQIKALLTSVEGEIGADKNSYQPQPVEALYEAAQADRRLAAEQLLQVAEAWESGEERTQTPAAELFGQVYYLAALSALAADAAGYLLENAIPKPPEAGTAHGRRGAPK